MEQKCCKWIKCAKSELVETQLRAKLNSWQSLMVNVLYWIAEWIDTISIWLLEDLYFVKLTAGNDCVSVARLTAGSDCVFQLEDKVHQGERDFEQISKIIRKEVTRFEVRKPGPEATRWECGGKSPRPILFFLMVFFFSLFFSFHNRNKEWKTSKASSLNTWNLWFKHNSRYSWKQLVSNSNTVNIGNVFLFL